MRKVRSQVILPHWVDSKKLCDEKIQELLEQINESNN